jgi:hypothetical protein
VKKLYPPKGDRFLLSEMTSNKNGTATKTWLGIVESTTSTTYNKSQVLCWLGATWGHSTLNKYSKIPQMSSVHTQKQIIGGTLCTNFSERLNRLVFLCNQTLQICDEERRECQIQMQGTVALAILLWVLKWKHHVITSTSSPCDHMVFPRYCIHWTAYGFLT